MVFKKLKSIFSRAGTNFTERQKILENRKEEIERSTKGIDIDIILEKRKWIGQDRHGRGTRVTAINTWAQAVEDCAREEGKKLHPIEKLIELERLCNKAINGALYVSCYNRGSALKEIDEINEEIKSLKKKKVKRLEKLGKELKDVKKLGKTAFKDKSSIIKVNKIKDKITKKFSEYKSRIYNGLEMYSWIDTALIPRMALMGSKSAPAMIVGFLPLTSLYYVERARSDRVLKIRAVGGVFLAHQEGGNDTLVVKGIFTGITRQIWLLFLQYLQKYGENASINARLSQMRGLLPSFGDIVGGGERSIKDIKNFVEGGEDTGIIDQEIYSFEYHKTFTIVTGTDILMDMYLQTLQFENKVENGRHVIKYTCIFQKYIKPSYFFMTKKGEEKTDPLTYKQKTGETGYYKAKEELIDGVWKIWKAAIEAGDIIGRSTNPFTAYIDPRASLVDNDLIHGFQLEMMIG